VFTGRRVNNPRKEEKTNHQDTKTQRHEGNQEAKHGVCLPGELGIVKCAPVIEENIMRIGF
jgi:hypothetical protein